MACFFVFPKRQKPFGFQMSLDIFRTWQSSLFPSASTLTPTNFRFAHIDESLGAPKNCKPLGLLFCLHLRDSKHFMLVKQFLLGTPNLRLSVVGTPSVSLPPDNCCRATMRVIMISHLNFSIIFFNFLKNYWSTLSLWLLI